VINFVRVTAQAAPSIRVADYPLPTKLHSSHVGKKRHRYHAFLSGPPFREIRRGDRRSRGSEGLRRLNENIGAHRRNRSGLFVIGTTQREQAAIRKWRAPCQQSEPTNREYHWR
jgi:hypothetical protein